MAAMGHNGSKGKALQEAARDGNLNEVRRLLQEGVDPSYSWYNYAEEVGVALVVLAKEKS
jgi:hypothetical protein